MAYNQKQPLLNSQNYSLYDKQQDSRNLRYVSIKDPNSFENAVKELDFAKQYNNRIESSQSKNFPLKNYLPASNLKDCKDEQIGKFLDQGKKNLEANENLKKNSPNYQISDYVTHTSHSEKLQKQSKDFNRVYSSKKNNFLITDNFYENNKVVSTQKPLVKRIEPHLNHNQHIESKKCFKKETNFNPLFDMDKIYTDDTGKTKISYKNNTKKQLDGSLSNIYKINSEKCLLPSQRTEKLPNRVMNNQTSQQEMRNLLSNHYGFHQAQDVTHKCNFNEQNGVIQSKILQKKLKEVTGKI